ncbi:MAG: hypothetical protein NC388_00275 [Clostridium sp.]|nr:hypothetical protein [Clostridium sp.]
MKNKLLFAMGLIAFASAVRAQHVEFSGMPLTGDIISFSRALVDRGYRLQKRVASEYYYIFKGMYAGHSSYFQVNYTPSSNTVYQVRVTPTHVNTLVYRDSVASIYGSEYETTSQGYRWMTDEGMIMLAVPEEKDPILLIMDLKGARLNKKERE